MTPGDAFLVGCKPGNDNCPDDAGPDFDFGISPILRRLAGGRSVIAIGQKSGVAYGMDPDRKGTVIWQYRAGQGSALGGIEWGSAADDRVMYVPVSDVLHAAAGGLHAIGLGSGERIWQAAAPRPPARPGWAARRRSRRRSASSPAWCSPGPSTGICAPTTPPTAGFSGRRHGARLRDRERRAGVGRLVRWPGPDRGRRHGVLGMGYGRWRGRPGNVLLAFTVRE